MEGPGRRGGRHRPHSPGAAARGRAGRGGLRRGQRDHRRAQPRADPDPGSLRRPSEEEERRPGAVRRGGQPGGHDLRRRLRRGAPAPARRPARLRGAAAALPRREAAPEGPAGDTPGGLRRRDVRVDGGDRPHRGRDRPRQPHGARGGAGEEPVRPGRGSQPPAPRGGPLRRGRDRGDHGRRRGRPPALGAPGPQPGSGHHPRGPTRVPRRRPAADDPGGDLRPWRTEGGGEGLPLAPRGGDRWNAGSNQRRRGG